MASSEGNPRFGPSYEWDLTDPKVQDAYIAEMLKWDGKFASSGFGLNQLGLTVDHVDLSDTGNPEGSACYTAASKESLHISMLALVVKKKRLAWYWIPGAADKDAAAAVAVERLTSIIDAYEAFNATYPGLGGFLPWVSVTDAGLKLDKPEKVALPALDNGQLAWAMVAAATALEKAGQADLAARYAAFVDKMAEAVNTLFIRPEDGKPATIATVADPAAPVDASNTEITGTSSYPFEGELMVFFQDMYGKWEDEAKKENLWLNVRFNTRQTKEFTHDTLPNGPITVQEGWRFSAHEMWKYMILPYFDFPMAKRIFDNGERARTWYSKTKNIPGLLASCYDKNKKYRDTFGIHSLSKGYDEPPDAELMVSPYGAFPVILADRGSGLAWHRAMVSRPKMQSEMGSGEATEAFSGVGVPMTVSWDTKVTTDLAAVGGTTALLKEAMEKKGCYDRFIQVLDFTYKAWEGITINGEDTPFAPAPGAELADDAPCDEPDFSSAPRLAEKAPPPATEEPDDDGL